MTDNNSPLGYKNPPKHSQFKKGTSGNSKGRPKRRSSLIADLLSELEETVSVTEAGRTKRITKQRLLAKALTTAAIRGNTQAFKVITMFTTEEVRKSDAARWAEKERKESELHAAISDSMAILKKYETGSK